METQPQRNLWPWGFDFHFLLYKCKQSREAAPRLMAPDPLPAQDVRQQEPENHGCDTLSN